MGRITYFVWTDIGAEDEAAFNDWYSNEHVPDWTLRIPGLLRGRRFRALSGGPRYIAYYEMVDREVFRSEPYVQMRGNPDPRSRFFVQRFRNALRSTATIAGESDIGEGLFLAIAAITRPGEENENGPPPLSGPDLDHAANHHGVPRVRLSRTDWDLVNGSLRRMDGQSRGSLRPADRVPAWMLTVEGDSARKVSACIGTLIPKFGREARVDAEAVMERISEVSAPAR